MKKTTKKIFLSTLLFFLSFSLTVNPALADFDWPSPSQSAKEAMDGIVDKYGINDNVILESVQNFNTARLKKPSPQVAIIFNPKNPVPGEKVTATAQPKNFGNSTENMYFTWYIKHKKCPYEDGCDFNNDRKINIEDYKIEAARIIANNGFEWEKEPYNRDDDDDGYKAVFGGDDQRRVGKEAHCFFHDFEKGAEYEFTECKHLFPDEGDLGDGNFGRSEEKFWRTNPNDPDTADSGNTDEANVIGLGQKTISWTYQEGDQIGLAVEGISFEPTAYEDASYKVMWALSRNKCGLIDDAFKDPGEGGEETVVVTPSIWPSCPGGCTFNRTVQKTTTSYEQSESSSYQIGTTTTETKTEQIQIHPLTSSTGGTASATGGATPTAEVEITTEYSEEGEPPSNEVCYAIDGISEDSEVEDRSCCPSGSTYCSVLSSRTETTPAQKSMIINQNNNLFKMTMDDFEKCLEDNLIDPTEGGGKYEKIGVELSYNPQSPFNDSSGVNADKINIESTISNSDDEEYLYYSWEIFATTEETPPVSNSRWRQLAKSDLTDSSLTKGLGAKNISFLLDFNSDITFIKAKLTVSEEAYNGTKKGGQEITIPLNQNSNKIKVFSVNVSDNLSLTTNQEICSNGDTLDPVCSVAKNQIIGVKVEDSDLSNFSWKINGKPFSYTYSPSLSEIPNPAYFAVLDEEGTDFNVTLSARNKRGEKTTLTRAFKVSRPEIKIVSADSSTCKPVLKGYYVDTNKKEWPDYSEENFLGVSGSTIKLKAISSISNLQNLVWQSNYTTAEGPNFTFNAEESPGNAYSVSAFLNYEPDINTTKALEKFWNSPLSYFYSTTASDTIKIKMASSAKELVKNKNNQALASLFSSVSGYTLFLLRMILATLTIVFITKILFLLSTKKNEF